LQALRCFKAVQICVNLRNLWFPIRNLGLALSHGVTDSLNKKEAGCGTSLETCLALARNLTLLNPLIPLNPLLLALGLNGFGVFIRSVLDRDNHCRLLGVAVLANRNLARDPGKILGVLDGGTKFF
jgi:hypothetical protein